MKMITQLLTLIAFLTINHLAAQTITWDNATTYIIPFTQYDGVTSDGGVIFLHDEDGDSTATLFGGEITHYSSDLKGKTGTGGIIYYFHYPDAGIIDLLSKSEIYYCDNGISNHVSVKGDTIAHHNFHGDWLKVGAADSFELDGLTGVNKGFIIRNGHIFDYMTASGHTNIYDFDPEGNLLNTEVLDDTKVQFVTFLDNIQFKMQEEDGSSRYYLDYGNGVGWQEINSDLFLDTEWVSFALSYYDNSSKLCFSCVSKDGDVYQIYTEEMVTDVPLVLESDLSIFPNPTNGIIHIDSKEAIEKITIYNALGVMVIVTPDVDIDLSEQVPGVYFVEVTTRTGVAFIQEVVRMMD